MEILLVDDEPSILDGLKDFLEEQLGHDVTCCQNGQEALKEIIKKPFPMVIIDICMPKMNGIILLKKIKELPQGTLSDVVILTGYGDMNSAIMSFRSGAFEYILKPIDLKELATITEKIEEKQLKIISNNFIDEKNRQTNIYSSIYSPLSHNQNQKKINCKSIYDDIPGIDKFGVFSQNFRSAVIQALRFHEDRTVPVIIEGKTGTGKEIIARLIHYGIDRDTKPFVTVNCAAIPRELFESELFGYEGGSYTGSRKEGMKGKFELADGGTLFLDEIGELSMELQPKLLRAIQEQEIYPVGSQNKIKLDVRIICATNQNIERLVEIGAFREDLYYRLNVGKIYLTPLKQQKEAIVPLAQLFLEHFSKLKNRRFKFISNEAAKILENHEWLGNIRELRNTIQRSLLLFDDIELKPVHLEFLNYINDMKLSDTAPIVPGSIIIPAEKLDLKALENEIIHKALKMFNGNKSQTAAYLGIPRSTLRNKSRN